MTEKNIFGYKLFLALNISDFNLFFMWKLEVQSPQQKGQGAHYVYCIPSWGLSKYIETKLQTTYKAFPKNKKRGLELAWLSHFLHDFWRFLNFSCYIILSDQISLSGSLYFVRIAQYMYCNCLLTGLWRHKYWN